MTASSERLEVLVLYDSWSMQTLFVQRHLESISRHSRHRVHFAAATHDRQADFPLDLFDAIIIHFSVRMPWEPILSRDFAVKIAAFQGTKVLLIQDEYDLPAMTCAAIRRLGIHVVFTTVPPEHRADFYPSHSVPGVEFRQCLTGYVPDGMPEEASLPPTASRSTWIGYRGRQLPVWYGSLAREKHEIGVAMKRICEDRNIPHDIEWAEDQRIYGDDWFAFLMRSRVTLGTESGSNVVDTYGSIRERAQTAWLQNPDLTEAEIYRDYIEPHDNQVRMNQISPKIFEAIALKTGLVLFEGSYSGIISPDEHYIVLRKDFSNVSDVLAKVADAGFVQEMSNRAYKDIVASGLYNYSRFVAWIDAVLPLHAPRRTKPTVLVYALVQATGGETEWSGVTPHYPLTAPVPHVDPPAAGPPPPPPPQFPPPPYEPLLHGAARSGWLAMPSIIRGPVVWIAGAFANRVLRK